MITRWHYPPIVT